MSSSPSIHGGIRSSEEDGKYSINNKKYNKYLLFCSLFIYLTVLPSSNRIEHKVPDTFQRFPTVYYGSQLLLSLSLFVSFVGLATSDSDTKERFSRFCSVYSFFCLLALGIFSSTVVILPEISLPLSIKDQLSIAAVLLSEPVPLFIILLIAIPLLHYLTPLSPHK